MGRQFTGSGCMFLKKNNFFSSESSLMGSKKSLYERDNYGSMVDLWWGGRAAVCIKG